MNILYLVRGLPGTGKSTLANKLAGFDSKGKLAHYEADMWFVSSIDGKYYFNKSELNKAHEWCQLMVKLAMTDETKSIAVSNTFSTRREMAEYIQMAREHQYLVIEITMTGPIMENTHNVPAETYRIMMNRWEK